MIATTPTRLRALAPASASVVLCALLLAPEVAQACAVCFQSKSDASRVAFIGSTAVMTFLPLVVIGGLAWWVRRQFIKADRAAEQPQG